MATSQIDKLEDNREFDDDAEEVNLDQTKENLSKQNRNKEKKCADNEHLETDVPLSNVDQVVRRRLKNSSTIVDDEEMIDTEEGSNFVPVYNLRQRKR